MSPSILPDVFHLVPHPDGPRPPVDRLQVRISWTESGGLALHYLLEGRLESLRVPASRPAGRGERLYEHTCFEAFLGTRGSEAYREFNFAPSTEWAVYDFLAYRQPGDPAPDLDPGIRVHRAPNLLELEAVIPAAALLPEPHRLALSAVIQDSDGGCAYWAVHHPPGQPDFHHKDAFAITLAGPGGARP